MARPNQYVLTAEAARIVGVSPNTARAWARDAEIAAFERAASGHPILRIADVHRAPRKPARSMSVSVKLKQPRAEPSRQTNRKKLPCSPSYKAKQPR